MVNSGVQLEKLMVAKMLKVFLQIPKLINIIAKYRMARKYLPIIINVSGIKYLSIYFSLRFG
jgi:hypothetical protein